MFLIQKDFDFSASHVLHDMPKDHPCARLHGHNYIIRLTFRGSELNHQGFILDYKDLTPFKNIIDNEYDHRHLNDIMNGQPSAENIAKHLYDRIKCRWPEWPIYSVQVSETPKTWAVYYESE